MYENVELDSLDLRYEGYRLRDQDREARLLASIARRGIEEPLEGVDRPHGRVLLNGFQRFRCARKLRLPSVPYVSLSHAETDGIMQLLQARQDRGLGILEQAKFVEELLSVHGMNAAEVAESLSRSKGWVSMRRSLLKEMSSSIEQILFAGKFPIYCYMYTLRPFMRLNEVSPQDIECFIKSVAGKRLSVRDIELLAQAYFRGPATMREAIEQGQLDWSLQYLREIPPDEQACNEVERLLLRDMQVMQRLMQRILSKCHHRQLQSRAFYAQANLLTGSLLSRLGPFEESMREFHDRSGHL